MRRMCWVALGAALVSAPAFADANQVIARGLLQMDLRDFVGPSPEPDRSAFVVRFAGAQVDASVEAHFRGRMLVNFSQSKLTLSEAWVEAEIAPWLSVRAGKFQYPITQERLTSVLSLPFINSSPASFLVPARDTGVQALGAIASGSIEYNLALVDGAVAGGAGDGDDDSGKDLVARLFVSPFSAGVFRKLGVGMGMSYGEHQSAVLPALTTYGGEVFFAYRPQVLARGPVLRLAPHLVWAYGRVGLHAETVRTRESVGGMVVNAWAWSVIPTFVLTGEDAAPFENLVPAHPFDPASGAWGALELHAGAGQIEVGDAAFRSAADPVTAMQRALLLGAGIKWYPMRGAGFLADFGRTEFHAAFGRLSRPVENVAVLRVQLLL